MRRWRFHPWDPTVYTVDADPCGRSAFPPTWRTATFSLAAWQPATGREVEIDITARVSSFAPLECPTREGFRQASDHTYAGTATLRLFQHLASRSVGAERHFLRGERRVVYEGKIPSSALEFGGNRRCAEPRQPSATYQPLEAIPSKPCIWG